MHAGATQLFLFSPHSSFSFSREWKKRKNGKRERCYQIAVEWRCLHSIRLLLLHAGATQLASLHVFAALWQFLHTCNQSPFICRGFYPASPVRPGSQQRWYILTFPPSHLGDAPLWHIAEVHTREWCTPIAAALSLFPFAVCMRVKDAVEHYVCTFVNM